MKKLEPKKRTRGILEAIVVTVAAEDPKFLRFIKNIVKVYGA